jgi:diphthamide biosynthesis protein 3
MVITTSIFEPTGGSSSGTQLTVILNLVTWPGAFFIFQPSLSSCACKSCFASLSMGYYDEIEIEDMEWDPVKKVFHYPCPCGDRFEISRPQLANYEDIAACPSCSLIIRVIYDPVRNIVTSINLAGINHLVSLTLRMSHQRMRMVQVRQAARRAGRTTSSTTPSTAFTSPRSPSPYLFRHRLLLLYLLYSLRMLNIFFLWRLGLSVIDSYQVKLYPNPLPSPLWVYYLYTSLTLSHMYTFKTIIQSALVLIH